MNKYKGLFTFDVENHRYLPVEQADGLIAEMDYQPEPDPKEPLIKDEKIRKTVRAWAEVNSIKKAIYYKRSDRSLCSLLDMEEDDYSIDFVGWIPTLKDREYYTIAELCGEEEAPEPIEPTFIDLDERIKEKEEEWASRA